ncbi:MAG TPA: hypothetical protein VH541_05745 [Gaiellaceae bacterium]|jgi:hypothetical protein
MTVLIVIGICVAITAKAVWDDIREDRRIDAKLAELERLYPRKK